MDKLYMSTVYLFFGFLMLVPLSSEAQDAPAPPPAAQTPDVVQPPPDFPDYIVTPREDLNNFDLSTMSGSEDIDYREGAGTLGTTENRQSNLEINAELEKRRQERQKAKQKAEEEKKSEPQKNAPAVNSSQSAKSGDQSFTPGVKRGLFMWKDENGVLHATNDLGHVPMEYQMQALEGSEGNLNLQKGSNDKKR